VDTRIAMIGAFVPQTAARDDAISVDGFTELGTLV
jgi:hypothetical protein